MKKKEYHKIYGEVKRRQTRKRDYIGKRFHKEGTT